MNSIICSAYVQIERNILIFVVFSNLHMVNHFNSDHNIVKDIASGYISLVIVRDALVEKISLSRLARIFVSNL
jgi:hypothetical protein